MKKNKKLLKAFGFFIMWSSANAVYWNGALEGHDATIIMLFLMGGLGGIITRDIYYDK